MKINKLYELEKLTKKLHNKNFSLCSGVFDILHLGHIKYFKEAKKLSDYLVVSVTDDAHVKKGPNRPLFNINKRVEALSELSSIDYLIINKNQTTINLIKSLKPKFYVKGPDYKKNTDDITKNIYKEIDAVKRVGGKIHYTTTEVFSSSSLINNFLVEENNVNKKFFSNIKRNTNFLKIEKKLDRLKKLTVLVIGDSIIDNYVFAEALNKSSKDSILNFKILKSEKYLGGALSVANTLSSFCKKVIVVTKLSCKNSENKFIIKSLKKNIELLYFNDEHSEIINKTRVLDNYNNQKQIGLHKYPENLNSRNDEEKILKLITKKISYCDGIVLSDFGHGVITSKVIRLIKRAKKKITANSQINSTNIGFHSLQKFKNIHSLTMNYFELQHETRSYKGDINQLSAKLAKNLKIKKLFVTNGSSGSHLYNKLTNKYIFAPGIKTNIIDRTGSGDTYYAFAALMNFVNASDEECIFVASLGAYFNLQNYANKKQVNFNELKKTIFHMFK